MPCPACGADASGKFCFNCGAPLQGAACASCRAPLTPGAKFCHRCGTPTTGPRAAVPLPRTSAVGNALPWSVAGIALLALIAMLAGQRFGGRSADTEGTSTSMSRPSGAAAIDISAMSPAERAERLYDRIMSASERGRLDSVQFHLPMALQAYADLGALNTDQRYDLGRLAEIGGDARVAAAQADTILRAQPQHLLGLILASRAARMRSDAAAEARFLRRFATAEPTERTRQLPEYGLHKNDIDQALAEWRRRGSR